MSEKTRNLEWRQRSKEYQTSDALIQVLGTTTDTIKLTHPLVRVDSSAGVCTLALPNGEAGQILAIISDDANNVDIVPVTATGWSEIALDAVSDMCVLLYANDTAGSIILSLTSAIVDDSPAYTAA